MLPNSNEPHADYQVLCLLFVELQPWRSALKRNSRPHRANRYFRSRRFDLGGVPSNKPHMGLRALSGTLAGLPEAVALEDSNEKVSTDSESPIYSISSTSPIFSRLKICRALA